jgi:hypothetical protein
MDRNLLSEHLSAYTRRRYRPLLQETSHWSAAADTASEPNDASYDAWHFDERVTAGTFHYLNNSSIVLKMKLGRMREKHHLIKQTQV